MIVDGIRQRLTRRLQELGAGAKSDTIKARLRQHQLGETFIAQLLKGRRTGESSPDPGISNLEQLAKALNVSRSWLILGIGKPDPIFDQVPEESSSLEDNAPIRQEGEQPMPRQPGQKAARKK